MRHVRCVHIYTAAKQNLVEMLKQHFPAGWSLFIGIGGWMDQVEPCAKVEIHNTGDDLQFQTKVYDFVSEVIKANGQRGVLVLWDGLTSELVSESLLGTST